MISKLGKLLRDLHEKKSVSLSIDIDGREYIRNFLPNPRLILLGGGHVGQTVSQYAASVGFDVTVVDDRAEFATRLLFPDAVEVCCGSYTDIISRLSLGETDYVTIMTRGHSYDMDCLELVLQGEMPEYVGLLTSRRRINGIKKLLLDKGIEEKKLDAVHMPIGISIGAVTPREIGISVVAEMIAKRRKCAPIHQEKFTRSKNLYRWEDAACSKIPAIPGENTLYKTPIRSECTVMQNEDTDDKLIDFLKNDKSPKALLIVYETSGSTPVKSGAIMAVNKESKIAGTIGGGMSENQALLEAIQLIGTGQAKTMQVDMTAKVDSGAELVCGGIMEIWMGDIS